LETIIYFIGIKRKVEINANTNRDFSYKKGKGEDDEKHYFR